MIGGRHKLNEWLEAIKDSWIVFTFCGFIMFATFFGVWTKQFQVREEETQAYFEYCKNSFCEAYGMGEPLMLTFRYLGISIYNVFASEPAEMFINDYYALEGRE
jgi:hypothetical protein